MHPQQLSWQRKSKSKMLTTNPVYEWNKPAAPNERQTLTRRPR